MVVLGYLLRLSSSHADSRLFREGAKKEGCATGVSPFLVQVNVLEVFSLRPGRENVVVGITFSRQRCIPSYSRVPPKTEPRSAEGPKD